MSIAVSDLTPGQRAALTKVVTMANGPRGGLVETCVIRGPAGTGKTTLLRIISEEIGDSLVVAPTGKAALRVKQATGCEATTIHKLLFKAAKDPKTGEVSFVLREPHEIEVPESRCLIADESSMIDEQLHDSMMVMAQALSLHVIFVGDLAQLPPVSPPGQRPFNILDPKLYAPTYSADLTEIVRQAQGDPLIQTSFYLRTNKPLEAMRRLEAIRQEALVVEAAGVVERGGAVICYTNAVRNKLNKAIREHLGHGDDIADGEPLVVNKNNYPAGMFNGELVEFRRWHTKPRGPYSIENRYTGARQDHTYFGRAFVQGADAEQRVVLCREEVFGNVKEGISHGAIAATAKRWWGKEDPVLNANFGYVITCHKAQGSEWPEVLAVLDKVNVNMLEGRRWLYTAVTRSKKRVRICVYQEAA